MITANPLRTPRRGRLLYLSGGPRASTLPDADTGGARSHILGVMAGFRAHGWEVDGFIVGDRLPVVRNLSSTSMTGGPLRLLALDIGRLAAGVVSRWRIFLRYRLYPDLVYERYAAFQALGRPFSKKGVPWILETQAVDFEERIRERGSLLLTSLARGMEARAYRECDVLVCVSSTLRDKVVDVFGIDAQKILVVPMGYDEQRFKPLSMPAATSERLRIVFVGELIRRHRIDLLLRAIAATSDLDGTEFELRIAGEGPGREPLERLTDDLRLRGQVEFVGRLDMYDVPEFIGSGDIGYVGHADTGGPAVHSSPTKLYEYMAMQKPVVAAGADDVRELVREGATGFLFQPGDLESLTEALRRVWRQRVLLDAMGENARMMVAAEHTWAKRVEYMLEQIEGVLR